MRLRRPVFAAFALVLVACTDSSGESTTTSASTGEARPGEASTGASTGVLVTTGADASTTAAPVGEGCAEHVPFTTVNAMIFAGCGGYSTCHGEGEFGFSLSPANAYANLVGVASTIAPSVLRVAPGASADSLLYRKLIDDLAADDSEGGPMPANALATMWTRLPDEQIELVRCWIDEGAPQD